MDTIDGMRTFCAVVGAGSFTGAAERLEMSTALVSKYVGKLEERLGARLLNRTTRSLTLTEIGRVYVERCRQVIDDFDELESAIQDRYSTPIGNLIISAPVTFGEMYLTPAISDFLEQQPKVTIDLRLTDRFTGLVDEGIDVAIRIAELEDSTLIARRLAPARIVACATPSYLELHGVPSDPSDLAYHNCIVDTNFRNGSLWVFMVEGERKTVKLEGRFTVNNAGAARRMLLSGAGIGLIPSYVVGDDIKKGQLVRVLDEFETFNLGVFAVYANNRHLATKVRTFVDFAVKRFGNTPEWDQF